MTDIAEFPGHQPCEKMDACLIDAYISLELDPENPTGVVLDHSWGTMRLDLKSIVKAGETITKLELVPAEDPMAIRYTREDGTYDCITGDQLSRLVSLQLLKDVDQSQAIEDGGVYMFNGTTNLFEPYDLKTQITNINTAISRLQTALNNLTTRVSDIESLIYNYPQDKTTKIARGSINIYGDVTNTNLKTSGIFTHDPNTDVVNDQYFS